MTSPFPGMDPYLEGPRHWKDFHHRFINDLSDAIGGALPDNYVSRIEEDVLLLSHDDDGSDDVGRLVEPDVNVLRTGPDRPPPSAASGIAVLEPTTIPNLQRLDPHKQIFLEIRRLPEMELVCVVELLSRTNKSGEGRGMYLEKRERLLHQPVSLVEIDLLCSGRRLGLGKPLPPAHYYAFISRADDKPNCQVYHWTVRDRLPPIPIPIGGTVGDLWIQLSEVFARTFARGRYPRLTDYSAEPPPPSFGSDAEWVRTTARVAAASA